MLRCSIVFWSSRKKGLGHSFGRSRVAHVHARAESKDGKSRFNLQDALRKDRERVEKLKGASWKHRLNSMRIYPWKSFLCFMIAWSYLGLYVVPAVKTHPQDLPRDVQQRLVSSRPCEP